MVSSAAGADGPDQVFRRVLVTGASVSADQCATSPGKRLGWRFGGRDSVVTIARGGTPGRGMIAALSPEKLQDRSVVVALDFFFWDSASAETAPSLAAMRRLVALCEAATIPLVVGNVPELLPGRQPGRRELNRALAELCVSGPGRYLLDLDDLHREAIGEGLLIEGRRYRLRELVPDGLHLSERAGEFLAGGVLAAVFGDSA